MNNSPIGAQPAPPPKKNRIILIVSFVLLFLMVGLGILWFIDKNKLNNNSSNNTNQQTSQAQTFSYKAENETISVTTELNIIALEEKDQKLYEEMKEIYGDDIIILIDQNKAENGQKAMYLLENAGYKGTLTERQEKIDAISENLKAKTGSGYEKTIINNYIAYKSVNTNNNTKIVEYIILGDKDTFSVMQISSTDLSIESDFPKILSTLKIASS